MRYLRYETKDGIKNTLADAQNVGGDYKPIYVEITEPVHTEPKQARLVKKHGFLKVDEID